MEAKVFNNRYEIQQKIEHSENSCLFLAYDTLRSIDSYLKIFFLPDIEKQLYWNQLSVYYTHSFTWLEKLQYPGVHLVTDFDRVVLSEENGLLPLEEKKQACYFATEKIKEEAPLILQEMETEELIQVILKLIVPLSSLHGKGLFHYSLSPYTITYCKENKRVGLVEAGVVPPGHSFFSPTVYTAPEVIYGFEHDFRCDIFSLGVTLYQLMGGKWENGVLAPCGLKDFEEPIARVLSRCLAPLPQDRFHSLGEFAQELSSIHSKKVSIPLGENTTFLKSEFVDHWKINDKIKLALEKFSEEKSSSSLGGYFIEGNAGEGKSKLLSQISLLSHHQKINCIACSTVSPLAFPLSPFETILDKLAVDNFLVTDIPKETPPFHLDYSQNELYLQTREKIAESIIRTTRTSPLVLLLDDIHLLHPLALDVLEYLLKALLDESNSDVSLFLVFTYQPVKSSRHPLKKLLDRYWDTPDWKEKFSWVSLSPFGKEEVGKVVSANLGMSYTPEMFALQLEKWSQGNPLHIQIILRQMIDRGNLYKEKGEWCIDGGLEDKVFHKNLENSIPSYLETINPLCQKILQLLSLSDTALPLTALFASLDIPGEQIISAIFYLHSSGLITFTFHLRLKFTSSSVKSYVQADIAEEKRKIFALSLAGGIESSNFNSYTSFLLSRLYKKAQDEVKMMQSLDKALSKAIQLGLLRKASELVEEYRKLGEKPEIPPENHLYLAELEYYLKKYKASFSLFQNIRKEEPRDSLLSLLRLCAIYTKQGAFDEAEKYREQAWRKIEKGSDFLLEALYYSIYAQLRHRQEKMESSNSYREKGLECILEHYPKLENKAKAITLYQQIIKNSMVWEKASSLAPFTKRGIEIAQKINQVGAGANLMQMYATLKRQSGDYSEALDYFQRSLLLFEQLQLPYAVVLASLDMGQLYLLLGCFDKYLPLVEKADVLAHRNQLPALQAEVYYSRGKFFLQKGEREEAFDHFEKALGLYQKYELKDRLAFTLGDLSSAYLEEDLHQAKIYWEKGEKIQQELNYPHLQSYLALIRIQIAFREGDTGVEIEQLLENTIKYVEQRGEKGFLWQLYFQKASLLQKRGEDVALPLEEFRRSYELAQSCLDGLSEDIQKNFWKMFEPQRLQESLKNINTEFSMSVSHHSKTLAAIPENFEKTLMDYQEEMDISHLNALREENLNLVKLLDINQKLLGEHHLPNLLELIIDTAIELTNAERGFIILTDEELTKQGNKKEFEVARNFEKEAIDNPQLEISHSITEKVVRTGIPILASDAIEDGRFDGYRSVNELKLHSVLAVPLINKGQTIGAVYIDNRFQKAVFSQKEKNLLEAFATQATLAIENTRLLEENKRKQTEIKGLNQDLASANTKLEKKVENQKEELKEVKYILSQKQENLQNKYNQSNIIGKSAPMLDLFRILDKVSDRNIPIFIHGESGTGKELVARAIHYNSLRQKHNFMSENCASFVDSLGANELFGHVKGAYTGADSDKKGLFEWADKGTLFLDEVGDMSPTMQANLLRVLETNRVRRVGGKEDIPVDVRIVSASNKDLKKLVEESEFREDLFFRLKVVQIDLPPLRDRKEDIPLLVDHFLREFTQENETPVNSVDKKAMQLLSDYSWPGNIRELRNIMYYALSIYEVETLTADHFKEISETAEKKIIDLFNEELSVDDYARNFVLAKQEKYNDVQLAKILGFSRKTLWEKRKKWGISKNG